MLLVTRVDLIKIKILRIIMRTQKDFKPKIKLVETNKNHIQFLSSSFFFWAFLLPLNQQSKHLILQLLRGSSQDNLCDSFGSNPLWDTILHSVSINEITTALELVCSWHPVMIQYIVLIVSFVGFIDIYTALDSIKQWISYPTNQTNKVTASV